MERPHDGDNGHRSEGDVENRVNAGWGDARSGMSALPTVLRTLLWLWVFAGCVTAGAQERPRVVRTSSENRALSVDPATTELRVTFDQPMETRERVYRPMFTLHFPADLQTRIR